MSPGGYAAIILAAGFSSRMNEFKPLLMLGGETITDRVISTFRQNDIDVLLVTGWQGRELVKSIKNRDITITENPDYESGMLSSVQAGVRNLPPGTDYFFIMPVDIPLVRPSTIRCLIDTADNNKGRIIYPVFNSVRGHPPLIPHIIIPEITGWTGDGGLDKILARNSKLDLEVSVPDENILRDIDNKEDYLKIIDRFENYGIPGERERLAILDIAGTPEDVRRHCLKVAAIAIDIGEALTNAGIEVDILAVQAAAMLHDIARDQPDHESAGARILSDYGFGRIGEIIALHQELSDNITELGIETKIVYLADKFVLGEEIVSIEKRYASSEEKYGSTPGVSEKIQKRKNLALRVKGELEKILGYPLDTIISIK